MGKKEAVIVGSGTSLLNSGLGRRIDSFHTVFRFRRGEENLIKHCHDTGVKTDTLVSNCNYKNVAILLNLLKKGHMGKIGASRLAFSSTRNISHKSRQWRRVWAYTKKHKIPSDIFRTREGTNALLDGLSIKRDDIKIPTTHTAGFNTLCCLLNCNYKFHEVHFEHYEFDKIYLCGFDYLTPTPSMNNFYLPNQVITAKHAYRSWHNLEGEAVIIRRIMDKTDKIEVLN
tara:strand:+ start:285 stop:971 length:687 start_codon:yes stop_codon:yes gene_type:complete